MNTRQIWQGTLAVGILVIGVLISGCQTQSETITVATDATWPPFEYIDEESKEIVGFDIDLMRTIAEEADLDVEFVNVSWDALLAGVAQGEYDAAISVITITDERRERMLFSDPYYDAGQVVVVRTADAADFSSEADLAGRTAGAQIGTTGAMAIEEIEDTTLKTYDTIDLAFLDLLNGQIDAVVCDNPLAVGYVNQYAGELEIVTEPFTDEQYGIAAPPGSEELIAQINEGLAAVLEQGIIEELEARWLSGETP
ncbi:MAG: basic amino acid ABC transporter substrate-binding protein [Anaerolineae bacterium]